MGAFANLCAVTSLVFGMLVGIGCIWVGLWGKDICDRLEKEQDAKEQQNEY